MALVVWLPHPDMGERSPTTPPEQEKPGNLAQINSALTPGKRSLKSSPQRIYAILLDDKTGSRHLTAADRD